MRARVLGALVAATMAATLLLLGLSQAPASGLTQEERPDASCLAQIDTTFTVGTQSRFTPAQTFTAVNTGRLTTARVVVEDISDVGALVVEIRAVDASGVPTDVVLDSASIPAGAIHNTSGSSGESTAAGYDASFDPGAEVVAGQQYAIVLRASEGGATFVWASSAQNPCPGQAYQRSSGGSFGAQGPYDNLFATYLTPPPPDTTAPRVNRVVPTENTWGIAPGTNVSAFFSEAMKVSSINTNTIKLFKAGTTTPLAATVRYDAEKKKAVLNPDANLQRGTKYKAVVSAGAKDLAGNRLDQNPSVTGNQPKVWFFMIRN